MIARSGWWLLAIGCHEQRIEALEGRVEALNAELERLNAEANALRAELDAVPPPTAAVRMDHDPPGFGPETGPPAGHPSRPDVILLSIDTLRADHLGTYGYGRPTSPTIDALAASGTVFDAAWSPTSWTLPSHTTMLSGLLPIHHGTIDDHLHIASDTPMLAELLQRSGYATQGVVSTLFVSSRFGFERGFDQFEDFGIFTKRQNNLSTVDADHVFHHALHQASTVEPGKPIFAFLHVYDVHYGYDPPPPYNERFDRRPEWGDEVYKNYFAYKGAMVDDAQLAHQIAQYDEEIAFVDAMLAEFLARWRAAGREAIVAVTADHGEEFGERGSWGHAHTLWPEQLHVPLVVNGPGILAQRAPERVGTEDIAPTLAALAGLSMPPGDGISRIGRLRSGAPDSPDHVAASFADTSRFDTLIYRWHEAPFDLHVDLRAGLRTLCKLDDDPDCAVNAYRTHKQEAQSMFDQMVDWLGSPWAVLAAGTVQVRDGVLFVDGKRLRDESADVLPGQSLAVQPGDALVRFRTEGGSTFGPWRPLGGTVPGAGCPVRFTGRYTIDTELPELSESDVSMLEAIGYLQADPSATDEPAGPSGPAPCAPE